jgi:hypothetical protein
LNKDKRQVDNSIMKVENGLFKGNTVVSLPEEAKQGMVKVDKTVLNNNRNIYEQTVKLESDRSRKVNVLQEVVVKGRVKSATELADEKYTSGLFKGGDGYSFDLTNDISAAGAISLFITCRAKLRAEHQQCHDGPAYFILARRHPGLFLNEMRSDAQALSSLSMADLHTLSFPAPFMGAIGGGGGGAIAVYTKKGGDVTNNDIAGLNKVTVMGYSPMKEFYSPDYAQSNPARLTRYQDHLLWQPFIFWIGQEKSHHQLYNNDISKKLRVVIEA